MACATATLVVAVGTAASAPSVPAVRIGWSGDLTGPTAATQAPVLAGLKAYIRMANEAGGVAGRRIELLERDDRYDVAREVQIVRTLIEEDGVSLVTGVGNPSGFAAIRPLLTQARVPALVNQGTLKSNTWPFQPYVFQGNCNWGDQADVALAYTMARAQIDDLKGVAVGIAGIEVASGQEWIQTLKEKVEAAGGTAVTQALPAAIVSADVAVQAFRDARVRMILMHHSIAGGLAVLRSIAKFGIDVPISGSYGVGQDLAFTAGPYEAAKNFVPVNCYTVPTYAKLTGVGKQAYDMGKKAGVPDDQLAQANYSLGWVNGMIIVAALKTIKGEVTPASMKKGLESIRNLDTGGLSPKISMDAKCHMAIRGVRPVTYNWSRKALLPVGSFEQWQTYVTNSQAAPGTCGKKAGR